MVQSGRLKQVLLLVSLSLLLLALPLSAMAQGNTPHLVVNTSYLNIRSGPGIGYGIVTTVPGGTVLPVTMIGADRTWFEVMSDMGTGWVNSNYAIDRGYFGDVPRQGTPSNLASGMDMPAGTAHVVVNTSYLNLRSGPGASYDVVAVLPGGTTLEADAMLHDGSWIRVMSSAGTGFVRSSYVAARGNFAGITILGGPEPIHNTSGTAIPAGAPYVVVNTSYLNVRTGPGAGHSILGVVPGGSELAVVMMAPDGVWYQVETSRGTGWVNSHYTVGRGNFSGVSMMTEQPQGTALTGPTPRAVVNTSYLNIRSGPGAGHSIVATVPGGTVLRVMGLSRGHGWYKVMGDFGEGWLNNSYVVFRGDFSRVSVVQ